MAASGLECAGKVGKPHAKNRILGTLGMIEANSGCLHLRVTTATATA